MVSIWTDDMTLVQAHATYVAYVRKLHKGFPNAASHVTPLLKGTPYWAQARQDIYGKRMGKPILVLKAGSWTLAIDVPSFTQTGSVTKFIAKDGSGHIAFSPDELAMWDYYTD